MMRGDNISRRAFLVQSGMAAAVTAAGGPLRSAAAAKGNRRATENEVIELSLQSARRRSDPYNEIELDVICEGPQGTESRSPGFWRGGDTWAFRFSGNTPGEYTLRTECSDPADSGLHGRTLRIRVEPYRGTNPLLLHGRIRTTAGRHHLEHSDGTPFLWIGDTWWMGLTTRLDWPRGFQHLTRDRVEKGFNVVQIIAGPYPDMDAWDERGTNEGGHPFVPGFARVNTRFFDHADRKITHLVRSGLIPCIVGMWGYYLPQIGIEKAKRYWRYLVARYGAYPVAWCICGEGKMAYYLSQTREQDSAMQKSGWTEVMRYVRAIDGYHNPISIHPTQFGREQVDDPALMDFEMLQTGHGDIDSVPNVIASVRKSVAAEPRMPVVNSEVNYEGIMGRSWQNVIRLCFYHSLFNGATGFTYGANGIWQLNTREKPYGPSPHGRSWGNTPWDEAMHLPGAAQVGLGGRFWSRFPWWEFEHRPDWIDESKRENDPYGPIAVGIPGRVRLIYSPHCWNPPVIRALEPGASYQASYFDPVAGQEIPLGAIQGDPQGQWSPPFPPEVHDWVLCLQA
jgi:hypothetical protein